MIVFGMRRSGNCWKVGQMLDLLGVVYEWREMGGNAGETKRPAFLALNPAGQVPALQLHDRTVLTKSNAILLHLAEGSAWLPAPGLARTRVHGWLFFEQHSHEPYVAVARDFIACRGPGAVRLLAPRR